MKRNRIQNRCLTICLVLMAMLLSSVGVKAQNVTVKSTNGNTLPAVKGQGVEDAFYSLGGFALWKHNQLNLTMTTADSDGASMSNGQFTNPANNIFKASGQEALRLGSGNGLDCYMAFSLPKGYRFTGYTIVFRRNINLGDGGNGQASFGETTESWAWYSGDTHKTGLQYSSSAARQTINRGSTSADDMGNVLYFKLTNSSGRSFITLESVELFFTAEADYTPVVPAGSFLNKTAIDISFSTSCVDIGSLENRNYNGSTRISYSFQNVKDLMGQMTLYEAGSITNGTNYDGTSGYVVAYNNNGTISSQGDYFKVGRTAAEGQQATEQIYYLETPTYLELDNSADTKYPIGYRIVGAEIKYKYGTHLDARTETVNKEVWINKDFPTFYISGTVELWRYSWRGGWSSQGPSTYYLTSSAGMSTNESEKAIWFIDDDGYIRLASDPSKYLKNNTNNRMAIVSESNSPDKYAINNSGQITLQASSYMYLCLNTSSQTEWFTTHITGVNYFQMINNGDTKSTRELTGNSVSVRVRKTQTEVINFPEFTPSNYTIKVYDKTGNTVYESVTVTSENNEGSIKLTGLNNDAIKIGVTGVGLIQGVLTIQALDPYIDRIDIVCEEAAQASGSTTYVPTTNGGKLTQQFTASDFAVSGGAFYFYVPSTFTESCLLTFKNLYSKYGDNTYYINPETGVGPTSGNSRYNFVMSNYWTNNSDLYATTYNPNHVYTDKIDANVVGDHAYTFNNAATVGTSGGIFEEYPFTLARYGGASRFGQMVFTQDEISGNNAKQKTAYLFTCDETRYNIAPTTATQHRFYAFYQMDVTLEKKEYDPVFSWTKVYDSSCYQDAQGNAKTDAMWGLQLLTENIGTTAKPEYGYLTVSQIVQKINNDVKAGNTNAPTSKDQILYVDGSKLLSIVQNKVITVVNGENQETDYDFSKLKEGLGTNVFVYLPKGRTSDLDNFAIMTEGGVFRAANNIILTDKKPFFVPYDIQVPEANYATYTRQISGAGNNLAKYATIMMPFTLNVTDGKHTNETEDGFEFYLRKMTGFTGTLVTGSSNNYYDEGNFTKITGNKAAANTPYMVEVIEQKSTEYSFIASQRGSNIIATPKANNKGVMKIQGEVVSGLTNYGTYSGVSILKSQLVYYFNRNKYVSSSTLEDPHTHVYIQPFRAYYDAGTTSGNSQGAKMIGFNIVYDLFSDNGGITTSLTETSKPRVMTINTGNGSMVITATENIQVNIMGANGVSVDSFNMNAGEQRQVNVPSGIYIVNNTKILVK